MMDTPGQEVPQTLEGWYLLHDVYSVNWPRWKAEVPSARQEIVNHAAQWLDEAADYGRGDSAAYSILTQKGDLMFLHYRESADELNRVELSLRQTGLYDFLLPAYSFLSVIEINMYELVSMVRTKLADQDILPASIEYESAFETEMSKQRSRVQERVYNSIPRNRYLCFYLMSRRRCQQANWYLLSITERRDMIREHGRISYKYQQQVAEVISGSTGLDDWEYAVDLHADDTLPFKKMLQERRFETASAVYTDFGPFYLGIRCQPQQLTDLLAG
ncbi:MAG: chlorite dismutase family protein [Planctomycetota bacterium]|jgi:chlorite dismutase